MIEKLDILDESGNPTGETEKRSIIHSSGLWHRVVHIYLYRKINKTTELLVHLRAKTKDLHPNTWDTRFGGHVKAGDSLDTAVKKELLEEIGLQINSHKITLGPTYKKLNFPNNEFVTAFFYEFDGDIKELSFKDQEVQQVKWMSVEDITTSMNTETKIWASSKSRFNKIVEALKKL